MKKLNKRKNFSLSYEKKNISSDLEILHSYLIFTHCLHNKVAHFDFLLPLHLPEFFILQMRNSLMFPRKNISFYSLVKHINIVIDSVDLRLHSFVCPYKTIAHGIVLLFQILLPKIHLAHIFNEKNLVRLLQVIDQFDQGKIKLVSREDVFYKDHLLWSYLFPEQAFAKKV